MFRGGFFLLDRAKKMRVCPPFFTTLISFWWYSQSSWFAHEALYFHFNFLFFLFFFNETELFTLHLIRYLHLSFPIYLGENTDRYISRFRPRYSDLSDIIDAHSLFLFLSPSLSFSLRLRLLPNISPSHSAFPRAFFQNLNPTLNARNIKH